MRGIETIEIGGMAFELVPSFENLDRVERICEMPIYEIAAKPKLGQSIKILLATGRPAFGGKLPDWWNGQGLLEKLTEEGKYIDLQIAIVKLCTGILTAGSKHDIKTVGADDGGGEGKL